MNAVIRPGWLGFRDLASPLFKFLMCSYEEKPVWPGYEISVFPVDMNTPAR